MPEDLYRRIDRHPHYQAMVAKRRRFAWTLSGVMLAIYYGFILVIAFQPGLLGIPIAQNMVTSVGIVGGLLVILSAFVLTGIYVHRANGEFDRLNRQILKEVL